LNFHVFNLISSGNFTQISTPFFAPYQDLHDTGFEYKNLPLFDAYNAIYFHYAKSIEKVKRVVNVHPDQIQHMFELLSNNRDMTTWQYDELIKYLQAQSYAALMEEKAKKEVKKEREMYQYEGPRHQIRQRGCCMDYDYENSNSDDDDSDDRYSKGKGKPKEREINSQGHRENFKSKKVKEGDAVEILMQEMMLERIKMKVKRENDSPTEKEKYKIHDRLMNNDRLKHVMNDLNGIKRWWFS
jgi:hypothetical protein